VRYIVIGFGKFGAIAVERLQTYQPGAEIVVLETDARKTLPTHQGSITTINQDGVSFLVESSLNNAEDVIIPMVPFHLAAAYLLAVTPGLGETPLPESLPSMVPNPYLLAPSILCCSRSDFICPDDCAEGETCTVTGEVRDPLFSLLGNIRIPDFKVIVLKSFQITPGVGGYSVEDLLGIRDLLQTGNYLLATSCRCHAVITAMRKIELRA